MVSHILATILYSETGGIPAYLHRPRAALGPPKSIMASSGKVTVQGCARFKMEHVAMLNGRNASGTQVKSYLRKRGVAQGARGRQCGGKADTDPETCGCVKDKR